MFDILFIDMDTKINQFLKDINWNNYNIKKYYIANSIEQGLQTALQCHPDIIVTELHFNDGNAMEMMKKILRYHPQCYFLIYAFLAYAEDLVDAMELGCYRCVMKNFPWSNIEDVLSKISELTHQLQQSADDMKQRQQFLLEKEQDSLLAQQACLNLLTLENETNNFSQIKKHLEKQDITIQADNYMLCVYDITPLTEDKNAQALVYNCLKTRLKSSQHATAFQTMGKQIVVLVYNIGMPGFLPEKLFYDEVIKFTQTFMSSQLKIHVGLSPQFFSLNDMPQAFRLAQQSAHLALIHDLELFSFTELEIKQNEYFAVKSILDYLICALKMEQPLVSILEYLVQIIRCNISVFFLQMIALRFLIELTQIYTNKFQHWSCYKKNILEVNDLSSFHKFMRQHILTVVSSYKQSPDDNRHWIIQQAKLYIRKHYAEDLTLSIVAKQIPVSSSYLSSLFSAEGETSFKGYLMLCRIEAAKELLAFTSEKISVVSDLVGFRNVKYFSICFKQHTTFTPSAYRSYYHKFKTSK